MFKYPSELEFQSQIIKDCTALGGFGDKIQDKYLKGKCDIWLRLPSGMRFVWVEVKLHRYNNNETIEDDFSIPQLEYIDKLAENKVPVCGMLFVARKPGWEKELKFYFKIATPKELELKFKAHGKISYDFSEYSYFSDLKHVIVYLDNYYEKLVFKPR